MSLYKHIFSIPKRDFREKSFVRTLQTLEKISANSILRQVEKQI